MSLYGDLPAVKEVPQSQQAPAEQKDRSVVDADQRNAVNVSDVGVTGRIADHEILKDDLQQKEQQQQQQQQQQDGVSKPATWGEGQAAEAARQAAKLRSSVPSPAAIAALRARHKKVELDRERALKMKMMRAKALKSPSAVATTTTAAADTTSQKIVETNANVKTNDSNGSKAAEISDDQAVALPGIVSLAADYVDEYDPMKPNSYEECNARRIAARERAEAERIREAQRLELERQRDVKRRMSIANHSDDRIDTHNDGVTNLELTGEEAFLRRAAISVPKVGFNPSIGLGSAVRNEEEVSGSAAIHQTTNDGSVKVKSAAERMMEKMGWKEGKGLGKEEQGTTVPLVAKKLDARSGVIVEAHDVTEKEDTRGTPKHQIPSQSSDGKSRVIVLRNMVGPGDVDAELESEVGTECERYGTVLGVLIFEVTQPHSFPEEEAVRIYVKFVNEDVAQTAVKVFNGRFFGGRSLRCSFFNEKRFDEEDLIPTEEEMISTTADLIS